MQSNLSLRIEDMLGYIDTYGNTGFDDSKIEELESILIECNRSMNDLDAVQVADSIYDYFYQTLKAVKPTSGLFSEIWEEEGDITEYTSILQKNPMMSIETAKSYDCKELQRFISRLPEGNESYFASYKINGHGIRVVYDDGVLVSATSRGRSSVSRDLTKHLIWLLGGENEGLRGTGLVEIRGELCLRVDRLEYVRDRFNNSIKSPFSAVASLIKPSATEEEVKELSFLAYGLIYDNGFKFITRDEEFDELKRLGFETPESMLIESSNRAEMQALLKAVVETFEDYYEEFGYFCDGVVFEINDRDLFNGMGIEGNHNCGNIALKVGVWEQVTYAGVVNKIVWKRGKVKLSPVAIVSDNVDDAIVDENGNIVNLADIGVLTSQGNRVKRVPLYEPKNILALDAYVGNVLNFRYGGEAGVVPCFPDGRLLKEDATKEILTGNSDDEWGWGYDTCE